MTERRDEDFGNWMSGLEERHLANLRVPELTRALRALSSVYVERRTGLMRGAALDSAGKRAAFALFYAPLHYLVTRHIVERLDASRTRVDVVVDLGCGTGAAGAAWAGVSRRRFGSAPRIVGIDRHPWAVDEARWTYHALRLGGTARRGDVSKATLDGRRSAIVVAFAANELADAARAALLARIVRAAGEGAPALVVEPVARPIGTWWAEWGGAFRKSGGREDTWRVETELPGRLRQLDRAAGLDHRVLTARSLYLGPEPEAQGAEP